jgi:UDP-N-acetylmuramate--alanine ligase
VADIYRAREAPGEFADVAAADLAERLRDRGGDVLNVHQTAEIIEQVYERLLPGDVLLTMGAGDIRKVGDVFVSRLRTYRAAG